MNILILSDVGFSPRGGTETYCETVAGINTELGNPTTKAVIGTTGELQHPIKTLRCAEIPIWNDICDEQSVRALGDLCSQSEIDLVHANIVNLRHYTILRDLKLPLVLTIHTWRMRCPIEDKAMLPEMMPCEREWPNGHCPICVVSKNRLLSEPVIWMATKFLRMPRNIHASRIALERASYVISPSMSFFQELHKRIGSKALHIYNPLDWSLLRDKPESRGDGSVVFFGRLEWEKGVGLLPNLARLSETETFHVAGDGSMRNWLLCNTPEKVLYHGFLPRTKMKRLLDNCSVVVVPSIGREMFSYVASEALAQQKPVVAFDIGGVKEQIEASGGGLLSKPFDIENLAEKVNFLLRNPSEAERMGQKGREWIVKNLNPRTYGEALTGVYRDAAEAM